MKLSRLFKKISGRVQDLRYTRQTGPSPVVNAIAISMVKNEQDIIEPFLRHNRQFFDAMIVLDHGSADRTAEIVENCSRELGGIFFTHIARFDYAQSEFMTAALSYAQSTFFADFVCFLDADEFIPSTDRSTFLRDLAVVPVGHASEHEWQTFLPDPAATPNQTRDWLDDMVFRRAAERPREIKGFIRQVGERNRIL